MGWEVGKVPTHHRPRRRQVPNGKRLAELTKCCLHPQAGARFSQEMLRPRGNQATHGVRGKGPGTRGWSHGSLAPVHKVPRESCSPWKRLTGREQDVFVSGSFPPIPAPCEKANHCPL